MAKGMKWAAGSLCLLTLLFTCLSLHIRHDIWLTLAITFGTFGYHFCVRLLIGGIYSTAMRNRADYTKRWFQTGKAEMHLYRKLNVKKWKGRLPTFDPSLFDTDIHTLDEIAQAMCQAELVHETIILLSFVPIIASVWFGALPVFVITSVLAACLDAVFVIVQRYNRPRVVKLIQRQERLRANVQS